MSVNGNENVNETGKGMTERTGIGRCPNRFTSLANVRRTISERKWNKAKHSFRMENEKPPPIQRLLYDPTLKNQGRDIVAIEETT